MRFAVSAPIALLLVLAAAPVKAEQLVVSLSNHRVLINSNFIGDDLVLFGAIEPDPAKPLRAGGYDLVVTVAGPRVTLRTRRKARVLGIWVNVDSREFVRVPSYLAVLSNRPVGQIASPDVLRRGQVGLDYFLLTQRIGPDVADTVREDPFRQAFVREQTRHGFYRQNPEAVSYLTPGVFRAGISLPADVPTGTYAVEVKLFAAGTLVKSTETTLEVIKAGFEQYVADTARDYGLLYGLATTAMALATGWFASVVFRKD